MTYQQPPPYVHPGPLADAVPPTPPAPAAPQRHIGAIIGALLVGIALGAGATIGAYTFLDDDQAAADSAPAATAVGPNFARVLDACGSGNGTLPGREVTDNGKTLIMQTNATGISIEHLGCVLEKLGASDAVVQHMDTTRALDGQQTDSWAGLSARWTYHPDNGLQITITKP